MKKAAKYFKWIIMYIIIWCILFEEFSIKMALIGGALGVISFYFIDNSLCAKPFYKKYPFNFRWYIKYIFYLVIEIYKAGFYTIKLTFSGKINPGVVDIITNLKDSYAISLLANSITLTPGTVTIDQKGNQLKVLWLNMQTKDSVVAGQIIKGRLEKQLKVLENDYEFST